MKTPTYPPKVHLTGKDSNAFTILGLTRNALKEAGGDNAYIDGYVEEATSGDYNHLLRTTMQYVNVK